MILSPRNQLIGCLLLAGIGLGLFFSVISQTSKCTPRALNALTSEL